MQELRRVAYCPFTGLCHDRLFLVLCRDMVFCAAKWFSGQVYNPAWACTTQLVCSVGMHERPSFLALCHYKDLHVATMFPGEPGGLGHDRGLLCHDRDFPTLCRDRNSVLQQSFAWGKKNYVVTGFFCHNRDLAKDGNSCRDGAFHVAIGNWLKTGFFCRDKVLV